MQTGTSYSATRIALHWAIAGLIVLNYVASDGMPEIFDRMLGGGSAAGLVPSVHVYAGMAVLVLSLVRLGLRLWQGSPARTGDAGLLDKAGSMAHVVLYVLMIAVPTLGAIAWFGKTETTADLHVITMNAMMILFLMHAAAALFHQYVLKDGLLTRMVRPLS